MKETQENLIQLIQRSRQGDPQAQEALVLAAQNRVYYHCKKMLKREEDAQDAAQDVLIAMLTGLDKLKEPAAFWGWVNGITANRCRHLLSAPHKEWQIPENEEGDSMLDSVENLDEALVPEKALDDAETRKMILDLVDALPPEQRMCVLFYYYDEMSVRDIAQAMGTSEGTVKSWLNYARKSIKAGVEDYERKGVRLYSASPILLLLFFLRREAESTTLDGAAAAAMAGRVLAGAAAAAGGTAAAGTAGSAAVASAGTGAAAGAAAPTAAAGISAKVVALILAAVVVLGGAVAVLVSHFGGQSGTGDGNAAQIGTSAGSGQAEALPTHAQVDVFDNRVTLVDTEGNLYMWGSWDESQNLLGAGSAEPQKIMEGIRWRVTTDGGVVLRYDTSAMTVAEAEAFLTGNVGA